MRWTEPLCHCSSHQLTPNSQSNRDNGPEDIDGCAGLARRTEADSEEVPGVNAVAVTFAAGFDPKELHVLAFTSTSTSPPLGSFVFTAGGVWRRKRLFSAVGIAINRAGLGAIVVGEALALALRAKAAMAGTRH